MKNRRTETRFEVCLTARWQGSSTNYNVRITDLSESGCYVDTIREVSSGERSSLKILLTNNEWFDVQGVVAHIFPQLGFGVRFVGLNEKQQQLIRSLINKTNSNVPEADSSEASVPLDQIDLTSRIIM
jgi:hypothetical protein